MLRSMATRSCLRCRKDHLGSRDRCEACRTEVSEAYLAGPSAIPEVLAVIEAARAVLITSPIVPTAVHHELAAALEAFDLARAERAEDGDRTRPESPSARKVARARPTTAR